MKRKDALKAIYAAGTQSDQRALVRIYTENRISYAAAMAEYRAGQQWAAFVAARDAKRASAEPLGSPRTAV